MANLDAERIRNDFPILKNSGKYGEKEAQIIYFDNACMSLKPQLVIDKIVEYYKEYPGCSGRSSHSFGNRVSEEVSAARISACKFFNSRKEEEIIFTRNTTEGINLVANSLCLKKGDAVLTTNKEHNSNLLPWQRLSSEKGVIHKIVEVDDGEGGEEIFLKNFENSIDKGVKLVSMAQTFNLDGSSIPVRDIVKISHDYGAMVMIDAAQSAPHTEIDVRNSDVDFLACSGHKMLGPTGTGILYGKYSFLENTNPFIEGGGTVVNTTYESAVFEKPPAKFEAGLQDYAGIIGLGVALSYLKPKLPLLKNHEAKLNRIITEGVLSIKGASTIGPKNPDSRSGILSFQIEGIDSKNLAIMLDKSNKIMIRAGAHCVHSWFNSKKISGSARASLYLYNTEEECKIFCDAVKKISMFAVK